MLSQSITGIKVVQDNIVKVTFQLTNTDLETGFNWRELGIIAEDPDTQAEVLFVYGNAGDNGEYIAPKGETDILEKYININLIVSNTENVTAVIDESLVFATQKDLEDLKKEVKDYSKLENKPKINEVELVGEITISAEDIKCSNEKTIQENLDNIATGTTITLSSTGWKPTQETEEFEYDVKDSEVTSKHSVDIIMDNKNQQKFTGNVYTSSYDGGFKVITTEQPEEDIELETRKMIISTGGGA